VPSLIHDIPRHRAASLILLRVFLALKACYYLWNCVAIIYISWYTYNYIISTAILDFWFLVLPESATNGSIEKFDPENIEIAVGIMFLASLEAEIPLGVVLRPLQHKRHYNKLQHMRVNLRQVGWKGSYMVLWININIFINIGSIKLKWDGRKTKIWYMITRRGDYE